MSRSPSRETGFSIESEWRYTLLLSAAGDGSSTLLGTLWAGRRVPPEHGVADRGPSDDVTDVEDRLALKGKRP